MINTKYKILVIDKKKEYPNLFKGFRKHKYTISQIESLSILETEELNNYNLFCIVIYDLRDVFEVLVSHKSNKPVIIASNNNKLIKKIQKLKCYSIIDLTAKFNTTIQLYDAMTQCLKL